MPVEILMPALSPTMEEGTLSKWLKNEGDKVSSGDVIAEIETDKATMEVEAVDEGTIGKLLIAAGTEGVKVNTPIAVLLQDGEAAGDIAVAPKAEAPKAAAAEAPAASAPAPVAAQPKVEVAADPAIPAGTEMVTMTVREALRDAMAEEMAAGGLPGSDVRHHHERQLPERGGAGAARGRPRRGEGPSCGADRPAARLRAGGGPRPDRRR